jgi:hypothetical protein
MKTLQDQIFISGISNQAGKSLALNQARSTASGTKTTSINNINKEKVNCLKRAGTQSVWQTGFQGLIDRFGVQIWGDDYLNFEGDRQLITGAADYKYNELLKGVDLRNNAIIEVMRFLSQEYGEEINVDTKIREGIAAQLTKAIDFGSSYQQHLARYLAGTHAAAKLAAKKELVIDYQRVNQQDLSSPPVPWLRDKDHGTIERLSYKYDKDGIIIGYLRAKKDSVGNIIKDDNNQPIMEDIGNDYSNLDIVALPITLKLRANSVTKDNTNQPTEDADRDKEKPAEDKSEKSVVAENSSSNEVISQSKTGDILHLNRQDYVIEAIEIGELKSAIDQAKVNIAGEGSLMFTAWQDEIENMPEDIKLMFQKFLHQRSNETGFLSGLINIIIESIGKSKYAEDAIKGIFSFLNKFGIEYEWGEKTGIDKVVDVLEAGGKDVIETELNYTEAENIKTDPEISSIEYLPELAAANLALTNNRLNGKTNGGGQNRKENESSGETSNKTSVSRSNNQKVASENRIPPNKSTAQNSSRIDISKIGNGGLKKFFEDLDNFRKSNGLDFNEVQDLMKLGRSLLVYKDLDKELEPIGLSTTDLRNSIIELSRASTLGESNFNPNSLSRTNQIASRL